MIQEPEQEESGGRGRNCCRRAAGVVDVAQGPSDHRDRARGWWDRGTAGAAAG
jgi:hypothetical protein